MFTVYVALDTFLGTVALAEFKTLPEAHVFIEQSKKLTKYKGKQFFIEKPMCFC